MSYWKYQEMLYLAGAVILGCLLLNRLPAPF